MRKPIISIRDIIIHKELEVLKLYSFNDLLAAPHLVQQLSTKAIEYLRYRLVSLNHRRRHEALEYAPAKVAEVDTLIDKMTHELRKRGVEQ